jgi:hypothetical protein
MRPQTLEQILARQHLFRERETREAHTSMMMKIYCLLLLPFMLLSAVAHLRGSEVVHHRRRHLVVDAESDDSSKEWIITAQDEDGADYVGSPALFTTNIVEEEEQYEIRSKLSSTSSLSV